MIPKAYLYNDIYKIRFTSKYLNKGKSNSFRLLVWLYKAKNIMVPLTIYYKGDIENMSSKEIYIHRRKMMSDLCNDNYSSR